MTKRQNPESRQTKTEELESKHLLVVQQIIMSGDNLYTIVFRLLFSFQWSQVAPLPS